MANHPTPEEAAVAHGHGHGGHGRISGSEPFRHPHWMVYLWTYIALLVLLFITVLLYYIDLQKILTFIPGVNLIVAMIVSVVKATLVVLFFMNVRGSTRLTTLWAMLGFIWLLFMGGIFMDYLSRNWVDLTGWQWTAAR